MNHKRQHYVPSSYLKAWHDPACPPKQTPYVWIFRKDEREGRRKSPEKIFRETDMYTVRTEDGGRDLTLEENLSRVERQFSKLRRGKLSRRSPLSTEELMHLCIFAASMLVRTKGHAAHTSGQWNRVLEMVEKVQEAQEKASPEQRARMAEALSTPGGEEKDLISLEEVHRMVDTPIQEVLSPTVLEVSPMLFDMPSVIVEAPDGSDFITSDDPCVWFDPANYTTPKPLGAGGLASPTLEITLPLSPKYMLYFSRKHAIPQYLLANR